MKILEVLSRDKFDRTKEQLAALETIFKTYPGLSKYSKTFRSKLIEKGSLIESHSSRTILKQGNVSKNMYKLI